MEKYRKLFFHKVTVNSSQTITFTRLLDPLFRTLNGLSVKTCYIILSVMHTVFNRLKVNKFIYVCSNLPRIKQNRMQKERNVCPYVSRVISSAA